MEGLRRQHSKTKSRPKQVSPKSTPSVSLIKEASAWQAALIVENDENTRNRLSGLLRNAFMDIHVVEAASVDEALGHLKETHFDLAFLDINLSDGSGIYLIAELAAHAPDTCSIVTTQLYDDQHIFSALRAGAYGYLLKEQTDEQLIQRLKGILEGDPPLSPTIAERIVRYFHRIHAINNGPDLTKREKEVLTLIAKGMTRGDTARLLSITDNTAAGYIKSIYSKLNISSRAEATQEAVRLGLIQPEI